MTRKITIYQFLFVSVSLILSSIVFAQKSEVPFDDEEWGLQQKLEERQKYWDSFIYSGPDSNIPEARARGLEQFLSFRRPRQFAQSAVPAWEQIGGSQDGLVSGRPTGIAFNPKDRKIMYLATSGAGVFKTTDGGQQWVNISGSWTSYAMGDVAVDPINPDIIYAGTGDLHDRTGDGFYISTDAGLTWTKKSRSGFDTRTNQIIVNYLNTNIIYQTSAGGILRTTDGGETWTRLNSGIGSIAHMVMDPEDPNILVAGGGGVIVRSTDGGDTWTSDRAVNITGKQRITMGMSAKNGAVVYASIAAGGPAKGLAVSSDSGKTWSLKSTTNYMGNQGWYDNACAVNPNNSNIVVVGGLDVWASTAGGSNLTQKTEWTRPSSATDFCHADIHVLKYSPTGDLYALTDGGVFFSKNNGTSWQQFMNASLSTLLFVGADADPNFTFVIGGTQDNGVNRALANETIMKQTIGGDGGRTFVSQSDPTTVYSTYTGAHIRMSPTGGTTWLPGPNNDYNVIPANSSLRSEGAPFYVYYDVCETEGSIVAVCGNSRLYYTSNGFSDLEAISKTTNFTGPRVVHVASGDGSTLYVAASNNYVYTTRDIGQTWKRSSKSVGPVSGFCSDVMNPCNVYAVLSGYGNKHFFRSTDCGDTWESPAVNLPDINAYTIARAPNGDLFIGHEFGVMRSVDNGVNWEPLREGLPLCDVRKLQVRGENGKYLLAATYGRGLFRLDISQLPRTIVNAVNDNNADTKKLVVSNVSPNPARSSSVLNVEYSLENGGVVTARLYDELGREIRLLANQYAPAGQQALALSLKEITSGTYFLVLTANGVSVTRKIVINE